MVIVWPCYSLCSNNPQLQHLEVLVGCEGIREGLPLGWDKWDVTPAAKDMKGINRDTCAPRYIQSTDIPQIPYIDSAPPSQTSWQSLDPTFKPLVTLAPYLFPFIPIHIHLHPPTLYPDHVTVQGVPMGTRYLSPPPFCKCCSLSLEHPFP